MSIEAIRHCLINTNDADNIYNGIDSNNSKYGTFFCYAKIKDNN